MELSSSVLMKGVSEALRLDGDSKLQEAYIKYIDCIQKITTKLLQYVALQGGVVTVDKEVIKFVRLGYQCMERVNIVVDQLGKSGVEMPPNPPPTNLDTSGTVKPHSCHQSGSSKGQIPSIHVSGSKSEPTTPCTDQSITEKGSSRWFSAAVPPLPEETDVVTYKKKKTLTPMEKAYRQNQQLMIAYKARLEKMKASSNMAASLSLTIQRKMAENLALAKVQEEALAKKMLERHQRLQEQANKKFGLTHEEQKQMYLQALEYEQDSKWFQDLREELDKDPEDGTVIRKVIQGVLSCIDHPLTKKLKEYQYKVYERLYPLVSDKMAEVNDIRVPLPEEFWPDTSDGVDGEGEVSDHDVDNLNVVDDFTKDQNDEMKEEDKGIVKDELDDTSVDNQSPNMEEICDDVRDDIETAIKKGIKTEEKLKQDNENIKRLAHQISTEYEKYTVENMDDLFDDDSDDDDRDESNENESSKTIEGRVEDKCDSNAAKVGEASVQKFTENFAEVEKLKNQAYHRHLKTISGDVQTYLEKMISLFISVYDDLKTPAGRDHCYSLLEDPFFRPLWPYLLALFRLANRPKEKAIAYVMTIKKHSTPQDFGVIEKLQLVPKDGPVGPPYFSAVQELCSLSLQCTMLGKLECLVKCSRLICQCVEEYYGQEHAPNIGADDLLPVLSYVVVQTGLPQIVSECQILEEFVHEGYIMGEEGYCLTSVQTAVGYLVSLGMKAPES